MFKAIKTYLRNRREIKLRKWCVEQAKGYEASDSFRALPVFYDFVTTGDTGIKPYKI